MKLSDEGKGLINEMNEQIKKQEENLQKSLGVPKKYMGAGNHIIVSEEFTERFNKYINEKNNQSNQTKNN